MESEIVALRGQIGLLSARLSAAEQAILEIRGQKSPAEAYVSPEFELQALEQRYSRRLERAAAGLGSRVASEDVGKLADVGGTAPMVRRFREADKVGCQILPETGDIYVSQNDSHVQDGRQRIQPRFKFRDMITKLLNFRLF